MTRNIQTILVAAAFVLLLLNFLFARLSVNRSAQQLPTELFAELELREAQTLRALALNYSTAATDIAWVALVVNYGEGRMAQVRMENLLHNAEVVRALDRHFYPLYEWFRGVWSSHHHPLTLELAEIETEFVEVGMETFPFDGNIPFHAAMTYVGIDDADEAARLRRLEKIVELLELAASRGENHPDTPFVLSNYRRRLEAARTGEAISREDQLEFLMRMYSVASEPNLRKRLLGSIASIGESSELATELLQRDELLQDSHQKSRPYAGQELFVMVGPHD